MLGYRTPARRVLFEGDQDSPEQLGESGPVSPSPAVEIASDGKYPNRLAEARACLNRAKLHLSASRNLKTEIKTGVLSAIERLYALVKEAEQGKRETHPCPAPRPTPSVKDEACQTSLDTNPVDRHADRKDGQAEHLLKAINDHALLIRESTEKVEGLKVALDNNTLKMTHAPAMTTAQVQNAWAPAPPQQPPMPNHSVIVSSSVDGDTSDGVIGRIRLALDARTTGLQVHRVRKVKDQRVVLTCGSKEDMAKMTTKLRKDQDLKVQEAPNKRPLVVLKDLLAYNTDEEIIASLRSQNAAVLGDLTDDEFAATVKYRRRARNPLENHVVLQVSPKLWQRLTAAEKVFIDLQRVRVLDQTPLVQCTRCLGYGHGRRLCQEPADSCSHCGELHLKAVCPRYAAGEAATCKNCKLAKNPAADHNAFDGDCPIHRKWDAIARTSVAYC